VEQTVIALVVEVCQLISFHRNKLHISRGKYSIGQAFNGLNHALIP
jgi:hypothetical protein